MYLVLKCLFVSIVLSGSSFAIHEINIPNVGEESLKKGYSSVVLKKFKNIPKILNKAKGKLELVSRVSFLDSAQDQRMAHKFIKENKIESLLKVRVTGSKLYIQGKGIKLKASIKDILNGNYYINNKKYHYDNKKSFVDNHISFKELFKKKVGLLSLLIDEAYAEIPSENIYLAVSLMNDFQAKMLFSTENIDDLDCVDVESAKQEGRGHYCAELARKMVENNIVNVGVQVRKDLKSCKDRVVDQSEDLHYFQRFNSDSSLSIDFAEVINKKEDVMDDISHYLSVSKIERGDREALKEVNQWIQVHFNNEYIDSRQRISDLKSFSCLSMLFTKFSRRLEDVDTYEEFISNTCKKVDELQTCHKHLYNTTTKLRSVINDISRKHRIENKHDYLTLPRVRALDR